MGSLQLSTDIRDLKSSSFSCVLSTSTARCSRQNVKISRTRKRYKSSSKLSAIPVLALEGHLVKLVAHASKLFGNVELVGYAIVENVREGMFCDQGISFQLISTRRGFGTCSGKVSRPLGFSFHEKGTAATGNEGRYEIKFIVPRDFGDPGAFLIRSEHPEPFLLNSLVVKMPDGTAIVFPCNAWVSKRSGEQVFFSNKAYLPVDTPSGLVNLRKLELARVRGTGTGTRLKGDFIYDYDVYNDLGNPDVRAELTRPVLGGSQQFPYPRRIRTGRAPAKSNSVFESLPSTPNDVYLPAREMHVFPDGRCPGEDEMTQQLIPCIRSAYASKPGFESFDEVRSLFLEGLHLKSDGEEDCYINFPWPQVLQGDSKAWMLDEEFARQTVAGLNPLVIEGLKVFPPRSRLDPSQNSSLRAEHLEYQLEGLCLQEALEGHRLFVLDYYDAYMPYLRRINSQPGVQAYASRTVLFLSRDGTLKPVAIELSLPGAKEKQAINRVFTPPVSDEVDWLWELAKAQVATNDAAYHQGVSHWLRTHAVLEPFIIATHRQLSDMHPIKALLLPHCKFTLAINSEARRILIGAEGIIERTFFTGRYTTEITSMFYKHCWRFDCQSLPADLLKRGMAVKDPSKKHGIKLTIEDYPYAVDGLEIWDCIVNWVNDYVDIYYKYDVSVCVDAELQSWWKDIVEVGHADKKEGWPSMKSKDSLKQILSTTIWLASAHHAAVNFGQYAYAGFFPNRPTIGHKLIPEVGTKEYTELLERPERFFCSMLSTKIEAVTLLSAIAVLSSHMPGEEYLGERPGPDWTSDERVLAAFDRFNHRIGAVEEDMEIRNKDPKLKNRHGPVNVPYTLLQPSSKPGITGRGIPNSVSI